MTMASWSAGRVADVAERGDEPVHREDAVGDDELEAGARRLGLAQPGLQVGDVAVAVAVPLRLAQADAVDDRGVVELVADDGVLLAEERLEEAAVGVEAGGVEDGVLGAEKRAQACTRAPCGSPGCRR